MTEGPIGKYEIMMPRLVEGHSFDFERDAQAVMRILWGMFKKMVIADRANLFVTGVFDNGDQAGSMVLLGTLLYTVQIYCEFSGCMDIVCATGQLFGVEMQIELPVALFSPKPSTNFGSGGTLPWARGSRSMCSSPCPCPRG